MLKNYKTSWFLHALCSNFLSFTCMLLLLSCSQKNYSGLPQYQFSNTTTIPDYRNLNYWAAHPWKKDLSDSVPKVLQNNYINDSIVDVFFLHPTTLTDKKDTSWNADINNAAINAKTDYSSILYQATVFNEQCRVFAPRYRQAHIRAFYTDEKTAAPYFDLAYSDIKAAFDFYLQHINNGKPIIIASHSQGTKHAARLLKEYFDGTPLQNKLVCAYVIGLPVAENYFTTLPACKDGNGTGCFVSWRTYKSGYTEPRFVANETFKAVVVNPLTWLMDTVKAPKTANKGGVLFNFNKVIPKVVNAQIHGNVLWTSKPDIFGKIFFNRKNYHAGDINLFYMNIRENVKQRIGMFWKR
jgi:hypothetical protein